MSVLRKGEKTQRKDLETDAETGVIRRPAMDLRGWSVQPQGSRGAWNGVSLEPPEGANLLTSGFRTSGLWNCVRVSVCHFKPPSRDQFVTALLGGKNELLFGDTSQPCPTLPGQLSTSCGTPLSERTLEGGAWSPPNSAPGAFFFCGSYFVAFHCNKSWP